MRRWLSRAVWKVLFLLDSAVPKVDIWVVRTVPQLDDTGHALWHALSNSKRSRIVWLTDSPSSQDHFPARNYRSRSIAGFWHFMRARVVIHSHGVYGSMRPARGRLMVNVWHGMPVKKLDQDSEVGRWQTDVTIATSAVHVEHLRGAWGLTCSQVITTGLPRNDILIREASRPLPTSMADVTDLPLVLWLPTYRRSVVGQIREDGRDYANIFQIPGATPESVDALAARLGIHLVVKTHPVAPRPTIESFTNLTMWTDEHLTREGLSLYQLMAHAQLLITDYSSVWIDWLLLDRPCVFAIADLSEYTQTRGTYFDPLEDHLPGPIVSTLAEIERCVADARRHDGYSDQRSEALILHHQHVDDQSASRLISEIERRVQGI